MKPSHVAPSFGTTSMKLHEEDEEIVLDLEAFDDSELQEGVIPIEPKLRNPKRETADSRSSTFQNYSTAGAGVDVGSQMIDKRFADASIRREKEKIVFICMFATCDKTFETISEFRDHLQSHTKIQSFRCGICLSMLHTRQEMLTHLDSLFTKFECCSKNHTIPYAPAYSLVDQLTHLCPHLYENQRYCKSCDILFKTGLEFRTHCESVHTV